MNFGYGDTITSNYQASDISNYPSYDSSATTPSWASQQTVNYLKKTINQKKEACIGMVDEYPESDTHRLGTYACQQAAKSSLNSIYASKQNGSNFISLLVKGNEESAKQFDRARAFNASLCPRQPVEEPNSRETTRRISSIGAPVLARAVYPPSGSITSLDAWKLNTKAVENAAERWKEVGVLCQEDPAFNACRKEMDLAEFQGTKFLNQALAEGRGPAAIEKIGQNSLRHIGNTGRSFCLPIQIHQKVARLMKGLHPGNEGFTPW